MDKEREKREVKPKVYLAGPMRGYPEYNYPAFHTHAAELRALGYEVFNPAEHDSLFKHGGIRMVMAFDTQMVCMWADMIAVLPGWEESLGAKAEVALAAAVGVPMVRVEVLEA
jgi:hypothetical protein